MVTVAELLRVDVRCRSEAAAAQVVEAAALLVPDEQGAAAQVVVAAAAAPVEPVDEAGVLMEAAALRVPGAGFGAAG